MPGPRFYTLCLPSRHRGTSTSTTRSTAVATLRMRARDDRGGAENSPKDGLKWTRLPVCCVGFSRLPSMEKLTPKHVPTEVAGVCCRVSVGMVIDHCDCTTACLRSRRKLPGKRLNGGRSPLQGVPLLSLAFHDRSIEVSWCPPVSSIIFQPYSHFFPLITRAEGSHHCWR